MSDAVGVRGRRARSSLPRAAAPAAVLLGAAAGLAYVGAVDPHEAGHYPTCPFLLVTGLFCPGCGSLRALHALAHLDVAGAMARNPMTVLAVVLLAGTWLRWVRRRVRGTERTVAAPAWLIWSMLGAICLFWVLRNLPGALWLAP
ncbi:MAG TPA: DUF2752 domain-containing protein [Actinomycetales bacterium]|jgi:hypothetical protein